jgi:DNA-binding transcriptional ArsR family regulator
VTAAAQPVAAAAAVYLCADPEEAERLAMRELHAICPASDAPTPQLDQYRGASIYVTPRARRERLGVAGALKTLGCNVRALDPAFDVARSDPATCLSVPMFPSELAGDPPDDRERNGVKIGGALSLALGMRDLEFVVAPILTKGQLGTLTGHPGHCKTTFAVGLCVHVALDLPFGPLQPKAGGLVYIVSAEDLQGTRNRILAEAARLRLSADDRARLDARLRWAHVEPTATTSVIREAIEDDSAGWSFALIFVDTGPALFPGDDENDNVALRNFIEGFANWRTLPGNPAVVLAWHPSKGATADRLEPRGASSIKGTTDYNLTIWRDEERISVGHTKVRGQNFDPIEGRLSSVDLIAASGARYSAPTVMLDADEPTDRAERNDAREAREAILCRLHAGRGKPPTIRDLAEATSMSRAAAGRHLQHLAAVKPALVVKDPVDDRYILTKQGEARAKALLEITKDDYARLRDPG